MLTDFAKYLVSNGWVLEKTKGEYEVLRARKPGRPAPLLVYDRLNHGCGYSISETESKLLRKYHNDRRKRNLEEIYPTTDEEREENYKVMDGKFDYGKLLELNSSKD